MDPGDELGCPRCKSTKYRNPSLILKVNSCGHSLCQSCVEILFAKGSGPCPDCGVILKKVGYRVQLFDDPFVEREVDIRRRVLKDYCKTEEDFSTLREYNDYLEEIEHIVFNLVKGIEIAETNKQIDIYKKENADQIKKARLRGNPHIHELEEILHEERLLAERRNFEDTVLGKEELKRQMKSKETLIDDLMFSDIDAEDILNEHKLKVERENKESLTLLEAKRLEFLAAKAAVRTNNTVSKQSLAMPNTSIVFSTGLKIGSRTSQMPVVPVKEELFEYEEMLYTKPSVPSIEEVLASTGGRINYLRRFRPPTDAEEAGGYHTARACHQGMIDILDDTNILFIPDIEGVTATEFLDNSELSDDDEMEGLESGMDIN